MKTAVITIIYCLSSVLNKPTLAMNGSYCCRDNEDVWVDHDNVDQCLNPETNATTKITLNCVDSVIITTDILSYKLNNDGNLVLIGEMLEEGVFIEKGKYCLGHQPQDGELDTSVLLLCLDDQPESEEVVSRDIVGLSVAVSGVFFAFTAVVYLTLPEISRDLEGKSIVSLCATQAIADILLCILMLMEYTDMTWCAVRGFLAYYFLISSFFWMNAIAVQILVTLKYSSTCNDIWKKYTSYALYAWGVPAVLTLILIVINYHPGSHKRPGMGLYGVCWFQDPRRTWIYLYSVMAIILVVNLGIFVYITVFLWKYTSSSRHLRTLRYKYCIMFRLFIVLGLPQVFQLINSLLPMNTFWAITDVINSLQGVIVFLILVVFRRRVLKALHKKNMLFCLSGMASKYLNGADDEGEIVTPTLDVPMGESGVF